MFKNYIISDNKQIQTEAASKLVSSMASQTESSNEVEGETLKRSRNDSCTQTDISYVEFENCDYDDESCRSLEECRAIYLEKVRHLKFPVAI